MPGQITEQILLESMAKHTDDRKLVRDNQHGFTKGKSCLTNLVAFYGGVTVLVDKGRSTGVTYLESCKTLDMILHTILVSIHHADG